SFVPGPPQQPANATDPLDESGEWDTSVLGRHAWRERKAPDPVALAAEPVDRNQLVQRTQRSDLLVCPKATIKLPVAHATPSSTPMDYAVPSRHRDRPVPRHSARRSPMLRHAQGAPQHLPEAIRWLWRSAGAGRDKVVAGHSRSGSHPPAPS